VFVQLGRSFGARLWSERWASGKIPGVNECLPYGYHRVADAKCSITYSEDCDEPRLVEALRRVQRRLLGFDFLHVWRHRKEILSADIVWTHTELEHLAVLLLFQGIQRYRRPKLIAQSVWLFDRWAALSRLRRWGYRYLLEQADVLAVMSPENLKIARSLLPSAQVELFLFGINQDSMVTPAKRACHRPLRIISLGNDLDRDWSTLIGALKNVNTYDVRIASRQVGRDQIADAKNVTVSQPSSASEITELLGWADVMVLCMKPNHHVCGITSIEEAVLFGVPVICTDTGGLRAYFSEDEMCFVSPFDPQSIRQALETLASHDELRFQMVTRAQFRMRRAGLSSRAYAGRYREVSDRLLRERPIRNGCR
jgi:glycosyltransferase involved in cell wall biosynthesis